MFTKLLFKPTDNIAKEVAHIYEHEFINNFYIFLESKDINPGTIGWVNGDTFDDIIAIEAGFYSENVARLFDDFAKNHELRHDTLQKSIDQISLEENSSQAIENHDELKCQLTMLHRIEWVALDKDAKIHRPAKVAKLPAPIRTKAAAEPPKEVAISVFIETDSDSVLGLFSRFSIILLDIIHYQLSKLIPVYVTDTSQFLFTDEIAQRKLTIKVSSDVSTAFLENTVRGILNDITLDAIYQPALAHFETFSSEPLWVFQAIDNYRTSGVIASNRAATKLASEKNIETILEKIDIFVQV